MTAETNAAATEKRMTAKTWAAMYGLDREFKTLTGLEVEELQKALSDKAKAERMRDDWKDRLANAEARILRFHNRLHDGNRKAAAGKVDDDTHGRIVRETEFPPEQSAQAVEGPARSDAVEKALSDFYLKRRFGLEPGTLDREGYFGTAQVVMAADALAAAVRTQQAPKGSEVPAPVEDCPNCEGQRCTDCCDRVHHDKCNVCQVCNGTGTREPKGSEGRDQIGAAKTDRLAQAEALLWRWMGYQKDDAIHEVIDATSRFLSPKETTP